jgi:hypothetical protein
VDLFQHEVASATHRLTAVVKRETNDETREGEEIDDPVVVEACVVAPGQHLQEEVRDAATKCPDADSGTE